MKHGNNKHNQRKGEITMKTINIKGINFELCGTTTRNVVKQRSLYDVYANPSETKRNIWYGWVRWFDQPELHCWEYGVSSYNCNFFTINAIIRPDDMDGKEYMLVITASHNRAYEIV